VITVFHCERSEAIYHESSLQAKNISSNDLVIVDDQSFGVMNAVKNHYIRLIIFDIILPKDFHLNGNSYVTQPQNFFYPGRPRQGTGI
jgi:hypothetical protein